MTKEEMQEFYDDNKKKLIDVRSWPECPSSVITLHDFIKMIRTIKLDEEMI